LLAGGTDVGLWVTKDYRELGAVVYLGEVAELHTMTWTDTHLQIGSAVSLTDAMPEILREYPELDELLRRFASPPIRNAATLGGNIANGSPIGDSMPALMVIGTRLVLNSQQGQREIALEDFYQDYMVNALEPGEYLQAMRIPRAGPGAVVRSYKVSKRFDQDISSVCAAFQFALEGNKVVAARVAYGGLAAVVKRALACEQAVLGKPWNEATLDAATRSLASDFTPMSDLRATAAYRMRVAQNLLRRFYLATHGDLSHSVYEYGRAS
jgi:xanthine dehydrogenase small subunit